MCRFLFFPKQINKKITLLYSAQPKFLTQNLGDNPSSTTKASSHLKLWVRVKNVICQSQLIHIFGGAIQRQQ